jgi:transposase InsO family protein
MIRFITGYGNAASKLISRSIPGFDGAFFPGNGRTRYGTGSSRLRHNDRGNPSSNTNSQESLRALSKRPGISPKTVADIKAMIERKEPFWAHAFDIVCARNDIDHRLTKPKYPWTNGQVERMNRTIKDATVKRRAGR